MIYFMRHGESEANVRGVFAGQKDDSSLTIKGKEQAKIVADTILDQGIVFTKVYSSPLARAKDTAAIIAETIGFNPLDIILDLRLAEYDMGELTGTPNRDIKSVELIQAEGAETPTEFESRVRSILIEVKPIPGNVLLVSHAGVGRIIESIRENVSPDGFYDLAAYPNASLIPLSL